MKLCPNCNAQIADDSRFCSECGKEITQANVCPHCGASVGEGDAFCQNCGKSLNEAPSSEPITYEEEQSKSGFKKCLPYIIGAIILVAICGGGWWFLKNKQSNEPFETALVSFKKTAPSDNFDVSAEINIDYPQKGNSKLKDNVIDFILKALKEDFTFEEHSLNPTYEGDKYNGQAVVDFYGEAKLKEFQKEGIGEVFFDVKKDAETEKFISYRLNMGGFAGGVGIGLSYGTSFNKTDGSIIQVIKDPNESSFKNFLISHVKSHLMKEGGAELLDESEVKAHPYPKKAPYLSKDGICFIYQKYEIGPGVMGEVEFVIPYNKMQPYMSEEALSLIDLSSNNNIKNDAEEERRAEEEAEQMQIEEENTTSSSNSSGDYSNDNISNNQADVSNALSECESQIRSIQSEIESLCNTYVQLISRGDADEFKHERMRMTLIRGVGEWQSKANTIFDRCIGKLNSMGETNEADKMQQEKRDFYSAAERIKNQALQRTGDDYYN